MNLKSLLKNKYFHIIAAVVISVLLTINFSSNSFKTEIRDYESKIEHIEEEKNAIHLENQDYMSKNAKFRVTITELEEKLEKKNTEINIERLFWENGNLKVERIWKKTDVIKIHKDVFDTTSVIDTSEVVIKKTVYDTTNIINKIDVEHITDSTSIVEIPMKKFRLYTSAGVEYDGSINNNLKLGAKYDINSLLFISGEVKNNNFNEFDLGNSSIGVNLGLKLDL